MEGRLFLLLSSYGAAGRNTYLGLGVLKNKDWLFYVEPDTTLRLLEIWLIKDFIHQTKNSYIYNIY